MKLIAVPSVPPPGPDNSWRKKINVNELQNMLKNSGKENDLKNNKNNN